jgi:hypothetical protein
MKLSHYQLYSPPFMKRLIYIPLVLIAIVLCIRLVHEPDLWWQLRTGEYILEKGSVPDKDVFSYTYAGVDWLNVKWGFEVIQALTVKAFGAEFIFLPQVIANLLMVALLLLIMQKLPYAKTLSRSVKVGALLLFLIGLSYRMNGRPELVTYTFTAFYLFVFTTVLSGNKKWLYTLIPAQLLWTNLHEAYGVGMVMSGIFLATKWFAYFTAKTKGSVARKEELKTSAIIISSWLVTAIHPGGMQMIWHPYEIFTQLSDNQFTQEIYSAANKAYWQLPAFVGLGIGFLALLQFYKAGKPGNKFQLQNLFGVYPIFYVLLYLAFFYLSLKSYRNLPFLLIVATPAAAVQLSTWFKGLKPKLVTGLTIGVSTLLYLAIVNNAFYSAFLPEEEYGIGVSTLKNPAGSSHFIQENGLASKTGFTDYLISSFFLWDMQPDFKTFIDLRDLDVFEAEDIEISLILCNQPERRLADGRTIWQAVNKEHQFAYVAVLNNPQFLPLQRYLLANTKFKLVYADELSSVFVPASNKKVIANTIGRKDYKVFHPIPEIKQSGAAKIISKIFWPFYTPSTFTNKRFEEMKTSYFQLLGMNPS